MLVLPKTSPSPRHGCQPCSRGSRPSSRVPSALSLSASRFRDIHSTRTVQPTGTCRRRRLLPRGGCLFESSMARPPPCIQDRARRVLLEFRKEQRVSPPPPAGTATGGRQPLSSRGRPPSTRKGLPSTRSCSGRGRGRDPLFLAELKQDPPCPVLDAGRWSCHRRLEQTTSSRQQSPAPTRSRWLDCPRRVYVAKAGRTQGQCRRDAARRTRPARARLATVAWAGARLRQDQHGSTGKSLADTRAPSSLRRACCGRTPPKSYATACGLDSAHAPLLANTHPMNCTSP